MRLPLQRVHPLKTPIADPDHHHPMCRLYKITGRVQGVFFRESTQEFCVRLNISGRAVNLADGSVEVRICGDNRAIEQVRDWLGQGPPNARVDSVWELAAQCTRPQGFSIS